MRFNLLKKLKKQPEKEKKLDFRAEIRGCFRTRRLLLSSADKVVSVPCPLTQRVEVSCDHNQIRGHVATNSEFTFRFADDAAAREALGVISSSLGGRRRKAGWVLAAVLVGLYLMGRNAPHTESPVPPLVDAQAPAAYAASAPDEEIYVPPPTNAGFGLPSSVFDK